MHVTWIRLWTIVLPATCVLAFAACSSTSPHPAAKLAFLVQPSDALPGEVITPVIEVAIQDAAGNTVTTAEDRVTVALGANPAGASLSGSASTYPSSGVARFRLSVNKAGSGYTLTASAPGLAGDTSASFRIVTIDLESVSAGENFTCGVAAGGSAYCWGLIGGDSGSLNHPVPALVTGGLTFAAVSAGHIYACGLTSGGAAYCWSFYTRGIPEAVAGGLAFSSVSVGDPGACGLAAGGVAYCWNGPFGTAPVALPGGLTFAALSNGGASCGVTVSGAAYCWGSNYRGRLGNGDTLSHASPVAVVGGLTFATVSVGAIHACGVTTSGAAYCWGDNHFGQLGNGASDQLPHTAPVEVAGGLAFLTVSVGSSHSCGVTMSGAAYCWGWNDLGQLGIGTPLGIGDHDELPHPTPVSVAGGLTFATVSAGASHTCGLNTGGIAYCWGFNGNGQVGIRTTGNLVSTPARVAGQP